MDADAQVGDLGGVQPGHAQPADGEEGVEAEEEDGGEDAVEGVEAGCTELVDLRGGGGAGEDYHRGHLAKGPKEHQSASAYALDQGNGD